MSKMLIFPGIGGTLTSPDSNAPPESAPEAIRASRAPFSRCARGGARPPSLM